MCGGDLAVWFAYAEPPRLETRFPLAKGAIYWRELHRCRCCGHFVEAFAPDQSALYLNEYVSATYQDDLGIRRAFDRINALPPDRSDNIGRVRYVDAFWRERHRVDEPQTPRLLDVGAGLGVFPFRMKQAGWDCTTLDLDERLTAHHRAVVGVSGLAADVRTVVGIGPFDLITFNKVLEHIPDPVETLASASRLLATAGLIYIELPDGEAAEAEGKEREEYFLGHRHVFSFASYALLVARAGLELVACERLREPSGKFTLRGFSRARAL